MTQAIRRCLAATAAFLLLLTFTSARAAEALPPSWQALPPETVLMFRVPAGNDVLAALRQQTKFGAVFLSQERVDKLAAIIQEEGAENYDKAKTEMAKYNLKPEDWQQLFAGEAGFALAIVPRTGQKPLTMGLAWFEPGGDLSDRLLKAMDQAIDEHKAEPGAPTRVDSVIEGYNVTRLSTPEMGPDHVAGGLPPNFAAMTPEQQRAWFEEQRKAPQNVKTVQVDETHTFITHVGHRILVATTFPQSGDDVRKQLAAGQKVDMAAVTGLEPATAIFARFLAGLHGGVPNGMVATVMGTPGVAAAMPPGQVIFDLVADLHQIIKLADNEADLKTAATLKALGVDSVGPIAFRYTLDGNVVRSGGFLSLPAPRVGLMTLFDQAPLAPEPPAWAPTAGTAFGQVSFDLGKAYLRIKEVVIPLLDPGQAGYFQMVEGSAQAQLGMELPAFLSSLGHVHSYVGLETQIKAAAPADGPPIAPGAPGAGRHNGGLPMAISRAAMVWQPTDVAVWQKVFQLVGPNLGPPVQEQGFSGWRVPLPPPATGPIGLFLSDKYLTVSIGPEAAEAVMSWLRSPPEGKDSLRNSPTYQRAKALLPLQPCLSYALADGDRLAHSYHEMMGLMIDQWAQNMAHGPHVVRPNDDDDDAAPPAAAHHDHKALAAKLKALIPTDEEFQGMFGVSAMQVLVNPQGVQLQGAGEVPPPAK